MNGDFYSFLYVLSGLKRAVSEKSEIYIRDILVHCVQSNLTRENFTRYPGIAKEIHVFERVKTGPVYFTRTLIQFKMA
jgi:hypothetical protein